MDSHPAVFIITLDIKTKNPIKYCYLTGTKQKTNTMNKHYLSNLWV